MQKLLLIGAWFFGVTFIFGSLGALLEGSLVASLLMLVGGILLLPPIKRLILDKKPNLSRGKIIALGSILIFMSMFFFTSNGAANPDSNEDQSEPAVTKKEKDITKPKPITEPQPSTEVIAKDQVITVDDEQAKINKIMEVGITLGITPAEYGNKFNKLAKRASLKETVWNDVGLNLNKKEYLDIFIIDYTSEIVLVGAVDKNGELRSLEHQINTSDLNTTNAKNIGLVFSFLSGASTSILSPELSDDEALKFAAGFIGDAATKFAKTEEPQRRVEIKKAYMVEANQFMLTFRIEPEASDNHKD
ncbi:hypothetical protein [Psychrobacter sp. 4Bb]|uniref:hypothetical protein n=1 Tax=Psychrobacter sp. 4Bb TaxID=888436 RepID=UPI000C7CE2CA|nr:hypothetical protein [Psychrobacter sp. 4Bb]PKH82094.1 hypothetical protein CXF60_02850 [Psychrobacter sp. 4Bb]